MPPSDEKLERLSRHGRTRRFRPAESNDTGNHGASRKAKLLADGFLVEAGEPEARQAPAHSGEQELVTENRSVANRGVTRVPITRSNERHDVFSLLRRITPASDELVRSSWGIGFEHERIDCADNGERGRSDLWLVEAAALKSPAIRHVATDDRSPGLEIELGRSGECSEEQRADNSVSDRFP